MGVRTVVAVVAVHEGGSCREGNLGEEEQACRAQHHVGALLAVDVVAVVHRHACGLPILPGTTLCLYIWFMRGVI